MTVDREQESRGSASSPCELQGRNRLGHLLWESSARAFALGESALAKTELSLPAISTLEMISAFPGITASQLARESSTTQQSASEVASRLERLGFVERLQGRGRSVGLRLTERGREALITGAAAEEAAEQRFAEVLGSQLYEDVREILQEVRDRLTEEIARRASEQKSLSAATPPSA